MTSIVHLPPSQHVPFAINSGDHYLGRLGKWQTVCMAASGNFLVIQKEPESIWLHPDALKESKMCHWVSMKLMLPRCPIPKAPQ